MSDTIDLKVARRFSCFSEFSSGEVVALAVHLETVRLSVGQNLFVQGESGDSLYLVVSGEVQIVIDLPGTEDYTMPPLREGAIFGELAPLLQYPRSGTAVARQETVLWKLPFPKVVQAILAGEPWAGKFLLATSRVLAQRLLTMGDEMAKLLSLVHKPDANSPRVAEMERLRRRLLTEWSF